MLLKTKSLYLCIFITVFLLWLGIGEDLFWIFSAEGDTSCMYFINSFTASENNISLPILSAIPYSAVIITELKSGYLKMKIFRNSFKQYVFTKFINLVFTVILSQTIAVVLFSLVLYFVVGDFYLSVLMLLSRLMLGIIYALIGSSFGMIAKDKIFAFAVPVAFSFFISIIGSRFLTGIQSFSVSNLLLGKQNVILGIILILLSLSYIFFMLKEIHRNVWYKKCIRLH